MTPDEPGRAGERSIETCRTWMEAKADRCNEPAAFVIWGKFFKPEALGPHCLNHCYAHFDVHRADQYAVLDLRKLNRPSS